MSADKKATPVKTVKPRPLSLQIVKQPVDKRIAPGMPHIIVNP